MASSYKRKYAEPIVIDDAFFVKLDEIKSQCAAPLLREIASQHNVSYEYVSKINDLIPKDDAENKLKQEIANKRLHSLSLRMSIEFDDEMTFSTASLIDLKKKIEQRPARPKTFTAQISGKGQFGFSFYIRDFSSLPNVSYELRGKEEDVHHILELIENMLKTSTPANAWLYGPAPWFIMFVCLVASSMFSAIRFYYDGLSVFGRPVRLEDLKIFSFLISILVFGIIVMSIADLFPKYQFAASRDYKARNTTTSNMLWLLGTVLIPILFMIAPAAIGSSKSNERTAPPLPPVQKLLHPRRP